MIHVLRLGHRIARDHRISTHCGLVARAFGAHKIIYTGEKDAHLEDSIKNVVKNWGGPFEIEYSDSWKKIMGIYKKKNFCVVHLTMYGLPIKKEISKIRKKKDLLVVIGGEKVPSEVYHTSDFNISITNQPHSEVAALAVFLHEFFKGKELEKKFKKARIKIIPQKTGKLLLKTR
jgi:tRNA (cytidine56-2'-O)-methyltransferase